MTYLVIGAGGVGGCIGGYLADAGFDGTLIARGRHLEAIHSRGLRLYNTRRGDELCVHPKACTADEFTGRADVIFVCVKGYSIDEVVPLIDRAADAGSVVIPVLNIVGTGERLAPRLPGRLVLDGCIYIGAYISGPGEVTQTGDLFRIVYGQRDTDEPDGRLNKIGGELRDASIDVVVSDDIRRDAFRKFMFVSPLAAAGAYYDMTAGELAAPGKGHDLFIELIRELQAIADKRGYRFPDDMVENSLRRLDALSPDATASMQKDLKKGGSSEIDGLIFEPARIAHELGVPAPAYEQLSRFFEKKLGKKL